MADRGGERSYFETRSKSCPVRPESARGGAVAGLRNQFRPEERGQHGSCPRISAEPAQQQHSSACRRHRRGPDQAAFYSWWQSDLQRTAFYYDRSANEGASGLARSAKAGAAGGATWLLRG